MLDTLARCALLASALGLVGGANPPVPAKSPKAGTELALATSTSINSRTLVFRGHEIAAPPGVRPLSATSLLIGAVVVEFPANVNVEFNEKGEAVFSLAPDAPKRSWVMTIGKKKVVASATAHAIVPLLGVGEPRIEWSHFAYPTPTPREFVNHVSDLKDPLDASPYR